MKTLIPPLAPPFEGGGFDADRILFGGLSVLVQVTIVAGVALLVSARLKRSAAARYWVLCWSLGLMLISPMAALTAPGARWSLLSHTTEEARAVERGVKTQAGGQTIYGGEDLPAARGAGAAAETAGKRRVELAELAPASIAVSPVAVERKVEAKGAGDSGRSVMITLALGWGLGAVVLLVRTAIGWWRLSRILRRARACTDERVDAALAEACGLLGVAKKQSVLLSPAVAGPMAAGLRRPSVVLPEGLVDRVSHPELRDILVHELAHLMRRDQAMVLLQNLAAAAFWVHPLVRRVNVRLAQAREEVCDNHVLAATDAPLYSRTLLRLTEMIQPAPTWAGAAGLLTSRWTLESRVAGILDENRSLRTRLSKSEAWKVAAVCLVTCMMAGIASVALTAEGDQPSDQAAGQGAVDGSPEAPAADPAASPAAAAGDGANDVEKIGVDDLATRLAQASRAAVKSQQAVRTAHLKFWLTLSAAGFKADVTPERLTDLMATHDLVRRPESLRNVIEAIIEAPVVAPRPWSEMELHVLNDDVNSRVFVRETRHRVDGAPDVHVVGPEISLRWDDRNSQMNVDWSRDNRMMVSQLRDFRQGVIVGRELSDGAEWLKSAEAESFTLDGRPLLRIRAKRGADGLREMIIDEQSGYLLSDEYRRGKELRRQRWLGWSDSPSGVRFPSAVIDVRFSDSQLQRAAFRVVREARFNAPLADTVFQLGAPAGAVIVDSRQAGRAARRINRDVFDAASVEEVENAVKPYDVAITPAERDAFAELRRIYVLGDGEIVRRIAPPFPLSRNYLQRMLNPSRAESRRSERFDFLEWRDGKVSSAFFLDGITPTGSRLISNIVKHPLTDVDVPQEILEHELPGDFIYRAGASQEELAQGVSAILSEDAGRNVRLVFQNVERKVFVARGKLAIDDAKVRNREGMPLIAVNGGEHKGDHGEVIGLGDVADFMKELSDYVGVKIVDETTPSQRQLSWSKRWYDLPRTPSGERFFLKPKAVLALVQEQTGIEFVEQTQAVRVLKLVE